MWLKRLYFSEKSQKLLAAVGFSPRTSWPPDPVVNPCVASSICSACRQDYIVFVQKIVKAPPTPAIKKILMVVRLPLDFNRNWKIVFW